MTSKRPVQVGVNLQALPALSLRFADVGMQVGVHLDRVALRTAMAAGGSRRRKAAVRMFAVRDMTPVSER